MAKDPKPPFTEEDFKSACFDAFMEGRVHANWEIHSKNAMKFTEYFDEFYSGDNQHVTPAIVKIRNQLTRTEQGNG